jgi:alpha-galactosidase
VPGEGLDHGSPDVNEWMIQRYGDMIQDFDLDVFRQDGHPIIPADESADRRGLRQIRYIEGFYDFWDHLLERHPQLIIDNCAAGGRKIDIETLHRSIPLWRSDTQVNVNFDPVHMQGQTYGISFWVPISSGVASFPTPYSMRSGYSPGLNTQWHIFQRKIDDKDFDFEEARRLLDEYKSVRECFYGDYYPLTEYSLSHENWMAWQFHRDDVAQGLVQVFRRKDSPYQAARFKLHGLEPDADYIVTDRDSKRETTKSGRNLMDEGVVVELLIPNSAAVLTYKQAP